MKKFRTYLKEMAAVSINDLDMNFIKRAERVTSFNIGPGDFQKTKNKAEIQHIIKKHFFPNFDLDRTIKDQPTANALNELIEDLQRENFSMYNKLHNYPLSGIGPAEATLYFLCDKAHLGGGSSAGVDLKIGTKEYEIKAALVNAQKTHISGFKLGAGTDFKPIVSELMKMKQMYGIKTTGKGKEEIPSKSGIEVFRQKDPKKMAELDGLFQKECRDYFGNKQVIFMSNNASQKIDPEFPDAGKQKVLSKGSGTCIAIQKVNPIKCKIQVVTQGIIKPIISLR